jgi:hypothetical protein
MVGRRRFLRNGWRWCVCSTGIRWLIFRAYSHDLYRPILFKQPDQFTRGCYRYTGTVLVTNAPLTETYANDLRMIQIQVSWPSGKVIRQRQMTTFVSQYGMQKYLY